MPGLSDLERAVLDFESGPHWRYQGSKETAVREAFGFSLTRYQQELNALIVRPEALVYAPMTVKRLLRLREARAARRTPRAPAGTARPLRSGSRGSS